MVGVGEWVIKTRTAAFVGCGVGGARDLVCSAHRFLPRTTHGPRNDV